MWTQNVSPLQIRLALMPVRAADGQFLGNKAAKLGLLIASKPN
jgi:hypothetical protein